MILATEFIGTSEVPEDDGPESEDSVNEDILTNFTVGVGSFIMF